MSARLSHALDHAILGPIEGPVLVIGARQPQDVVDLPSEGLQAQVGDFMAHAAFQAAGIANAPLVNGTFASAFIYAARNREAWLAQIAQASQQVTPGGLVLVDGAKTDGIEAMARAFSAAGLDVETHSKAHGKLVWFTRPTTLPAIFADWAEAGQLHENAAGMKTAPGMFSHAQADAGSALLMEHLPSNLSGKAADLGAGWGWLSASILAGNPGLTELHLIESDYDALEAARLNVPDPRARFHWADATASTGLKNLHLVVMNPPFHRHGATDPDLGRAFIASAANILSPSGHLYMVANRQLPYEALLEQRFAKVTTLAQTGVYKIIAAERPKRRVA
jgi:16S rRNA (guanine1207-N2)-methyltransferase